jgi:hypothetical protein
MEHRVITPRAHHGTVCIVYIVLSKSICMNEAGVDRPAAQIAVEVLDLVERADKVPSRQALSFASALCTLVLWRLEVRGKSLDRRRETGWEWRRGKALCCGRPLRICAWIIAEVRRFVHVDPQSINVHTGFGVEKEPKLCSRVSTATKLSPELTVIPVRLYLGRKPVRECRYTWPNHPCA